MHLNGTDCVAMNLFHSFIPYTVGCYDGQPILKAKEMKVTEEIANPKHDINCSK